MQTANSKQTAAPGAAPKRTSSERSPSAAGKMRPALVIFTLWTRVHAALHTRMSREVPTRPALSTTAPLPPTGSSMTPQPSLRDTPGQLHAPRPELQDGDKRSKSQERESN